VHQFVPEHVGGTETYTRALALRQAAAGHDVTVLARRFGEGRGTVEERIDGLRVVRAVDGPFSAVGRLASTLRAPALAATIETVALRVAPDVVHLQHGMGLPAGALARLAERYPTVVTLHDYWWVCANGQALTTFGDVVCDGPRAWVNCARCGLARVARSGLAPAAPALAPLFAARALALRRAGRRVRAWVAPTEFVRQWHVAHGLPEGRTHTIPHGVEPPPDGLLAVAETDGPATRPLRAAYLGGLSHQKGVHLLVEAVGRLDGRATLAVAGDESVFPEYCGALRAAADPAHVHFLGLLDQASVWRQLALADIVVVPSLWYETSSLIAQEAFAVGTPVVASGHGALAERIRDGVDGLLFAPGDEASLRRALSRLLDEPGLLSRLRRGIAPVRTMDDHAAEIETVYARIAARPAR
jgi:glycosyltransferase involved in cell wall biosynthesis